MGAIIEINGERIDPEEVEGADGIVINVEVGENGVKKSVTGEMQLIGRARDIINDELIAPVDGRRRWVKFEVFDDCHPDSAHPPRIFEGIIAGDLVSWCEDDCFVKATAIEENEDTRKFDCLESTIVHDDHAGILNAVNVNGGVHEHPRIVYCDQIRPEWLYYVQLSLTLTLSVVLLALVPVVFIVSIVVDVINAIISVVNTLPGPNINEIDPDGNPDTSIFDQYEQLMGDIIERAVGCGRKHPPAFVRSYIDNVCDKCGITWNSSILKDGASDYYNLVYFNAPAKEGTREDDDGLIRQNLPSLTGSGLLDELKTVFNAKWRVESGILRFERRDRLVGTVVWIDPDDIKGDDRLKKPGVCYQWSSEEQPAYLDIKYSFDVNDSTGREAKERFSEVVEWNSPPSRLQTGKQEVVFAYGIPRFLGDGVGNTVMEDFLWHPQVRQAYNANRGGLLLDRGLSLSPKLLLWDGGDMVSAKIQRYNIPGYGVSADNNYNYPLHLTEHLVAQQEPYDEDEANMALFGRFHHIDNPRIDVMRGVDWSFEFEYTYDELISFDPYKVVRLGTLTGEIQKVRINPTKRTIFVEGVA